MMVDYHMHTSLSDGQDAHEDFILQAARKNLAEIGFSDHFSILETEWNTAESDIPRMKESILELKARKNLPIQVKFGAEIDYIPGKEKEIEELINSLPLDYVIGSVHFIGDWNFDTTPDSYEGKDIQKVYEDYFKLLTEAVNTGLYDIVGHADLVKKFNHRLHHSPVDLYLEVIHAAKKQDMTIELNTNGKNKPCKEFYPEEKFLELCYESDIPVIISSDAHKPEQVGQYFPEAKEQLKRIGYREIATYTNRKRNMIPLY
jgi:histidinol-phosphatase (PHP family)